MTNTAVRLYDRQEETLLDRVRGAMGASPEGETRRIFAAMEENLGRLSETFSHYPSILDQRSLGSEVFSIDTLVETLFNEGGDYTVLLPTKVTVGRSFMVAKFNTFGYLRKLCERNVRLSGFKDDLQKSWEYTIFSLLIEDVYQTIVESDAYSAAVRRRAAIDLIHLWEHRFDHNVTEYAPTLIDLWRVRKRIAPVFGTMLGTMELMRISSLLSTRWYGFLSEYGDDPEVIHALEEFIFGLTYEQIARVREAMRTRHVSVIDREELNTILELEMVPDDVSDVDPRRMYLFYQRRAKAADRRRFSPLPGPTRTLEEALLVQMIEQQLS